MATENFMLKGVKAVYSDNSIYLTVQNEHINSESYIDVEDTQELLSTLTKRTFPIVLGTCEGETVTLNLNDNSVYINSDCYFDNKVEDNFIDILITAINLSGHTWSFPQCMINQ